MSEAGLSGEQLLAWHQQTVAQWKTAAGRTPAVLDVPCDVYGVSDLRGLLHHIAVVQLRYAQRLAGEPESPYDSIGQEAEAIFAAHEHAGRLLRMRLEDTAFDWDARQEFGTISWSRITSKRSTMFAHSLLHGIRHFAQAAMLARQAGFKPGFPMDYLAMDVVRVEPHTNENVR